MALNNMGVMLKELGQLDEAGDLLRKALDLDPGYDKAHTNLGVVLQLQAQSQAAIHHHCQALKKGDGLTPELRKKIQLRLRDLTGGNKAEAPGALKMGFVHGIRKFEGSS